MERLEISIVDIQSIVTLILKQKYNNSKLVLKLQPRTFKYKIKQTGYKKSQSNLICESFEFFKKNGEVSMKHSWTGASTVFNYEQLSLIVLFGDQEGRKLHMITTNNSINIHSQQDDRDRKYWKQTVNSRY